MYQDQEVKKLIQQTISLIPEHTWPVVIDKLSSRIVDQMPSNVLKQLTGSEVDFEKAEKILLNFYLQSKEKREDLISDSFGLVGAEPTLYFLENMELDKIPKPKQKQELSS